METIALTIGGVERCVRICRDVREVGVLMVKELTDGRQIAATAEPTLEESGCRFCTACVEVCPTGALRDKDQKGRSGPASLPG